MKERVTYQWEQRKICTRIPAGTYKIFFSCFPETYKGSAVGQVHEQVAEMPDRKQKNNKFTFDKHPKSRRKYELEDDAGPLNQFIGKTVRISRTWGGIHQVDAGKTDE